MMLLQKWKKKLFRHIIKSLSALYDKPLASPTDREKQLVEELKTTFREFPILETANCPASEKEWYKNVNRLRELVLNNDPREFLRWHAISATMFTKYGSYVTPELKHLKSRPDWESRWCKIIKESSVGHPIPYWQYPSSSGNLIHHAYHLAKFEEETAISTNSINFVFEFGGGYGSMCRLLHNDGFRGEYVIFDLPAFSALQEFFLKSIGRTVHSVDSLKTAGNGIVCISDLEQLREILSSDFTVRNSVFIGTWSISEAPIHLRNLILPLTLSFSGFLISYQDQFEEVNNIDFFRNWKVAQRDIEWHEWEIEHMPKNRYLVGKRRTD